jgi:hypothetical protein
MELREAEDNARDQKHGRPSNIRDFSAVLRRFQNSVEYYDQDWRSHRNDTQEAALNDLFTTMEENRNQRSYALQVGRTWRDDSGGLKRMMGSYIAQLTNIVTKLLKALEADIFVTAHKDGKHPCDIVRGGMWPWFDELKKDRWVQSLALVDCQLAVKAMHECFEAHNYDYKNLRSHIKQRITACMPGYIDLRQEDLLEVLFPRLPTLTPKQPAFPVLQTHPSDMRTNVQRSQHLATTPVRSRAIVSDSSSRRHNGSLADDLIIRTRRERRRGR